MNDRDAVAAFVSDLHWQIDQLPPCASTRAAHPPVIESHFSAMDCGTDWPTLVVAAAATAGTVSATVIAAKALRATNRQVAAQTLPVIVELPLGDYLSQEETLCFPDGHEIASPREGQVIVSAPDEGEEPARISVAIQNEAQVLRASRRRSSNSAPTASAQTLPETDDDRGPMIRVSRARPMTLYVPPHGRERLSTTVGRDDAAWSPLRAALRKAGTLVLRIRFEDASGDAHYESVLHLRQARRETSWRVRLQHVRKR